jgi:nitrous oxide reductase accessory protein NosL
MNRKITRMFILALTLAVFFGVAVQAGQDDIVAHRDCVHCGMDRKAFGYSRMLIRYADDAEVGVCSLNCTVIELNANSGRRVKELLVADRDSRRLIRADEAFWVMGGEKPGVMTKRPKWAFATKEAAESFIRAHGGSLAGWTEALAAAREDAGVRH